MKRWWASTRTLQEWPKYWKAMSEQDEHAPGIHWSYRITQAIFSAVAIGCFVVFWYAGQILGIPAELGHGGSLLGQPTIGATLLGLFAAIFLLAGCTLFAHAFLRNRWGMASLAAVTAGFSAWSMRGGPIHDVLLYAPSTAVFFRLAVELMLLGGMVGGVWVLLWNESAGADSVNSARIFGALLKQAGIMAVLVFLLAQTDQKKQCVVSVFLAALVSSSIVQANWPERGAGKWFWIAPIAVGVLGYILAVFQAGDWNSGMRELNGLWAPLACPLPLDYASVGMFGSLLGYWMNIPEESGKESENTLPVATLPAGPEA
jgi:hypothetical protein